MATNFDSKNIKALMRRLSVFQAWRLGEHPFENRGDLFSESDINSLLDDVASCLAHFAECGGEHKCECSKKQQVKPPFGAMSEQELLKLAADESSRIQQALKDGKLKLPNAEEKPYDTHGGFIVNG